MIRPLLQGLGSLEGVVGWVLLLLVGTRLADGLLLLLKGVSGSLGRSSHWVWLLLHSLLSLRPTEAPVILIWRLIETSGRFESGLSELHLLLALGRCLLKLSGRPEPGGGVGHLGRRRLFVEVDILLLLLNLLHEVVLRLTGQLRGSAAHHVLLRDHWLGELVLLDRVRGGFRLHPVEAVLRRLLGRRLLHGLELACLGPHHRLPGIFE